MHSDSPVGAWPHACARRWSTRRRARRVRLRTALANSAAGCNFAPCRSFILGKLSSEQEPSPVGRCTCSRISTCFAEVHPSTQHCSPARTSHATCARSSSSVMTLPVSASVGVPQPNVCSCTEFDCMYPVMVDGPLMCQASPVQNMFSDCELLHTCLLYTSPSPRDS